MGAGPTRQGWTVLVAAAVGLVVGRIFGVVELYVIATAMAVAVVVALVVVAVRRPRVRVHRWIRPTVLTAGDTGRVEVVVEQVGAVRSPHFELVEPVGVNRTARMAVSALRPDEQVSAGYRIPTERRGVLTVGPLTATRRDVLGLASATTIVAGDEEVLVAPRAHLLTVPELGDGVLGRQLMVLAQRLGPGDFHSLRDYVDGDEPRTIHWRASARTENLKVRQHEVEGVRRAVVLLDQHVYVAPRGPADDSEAFERAVTAAASLVHSFDRAALTTRFVTTAGVDLRGPDVAAQTLHLLARIARNHSHPVPIERDPGEGLGVVVVVTPDDTTDAWRAMERVADPTLLTVGVFTRTMPARPGLLTVDATTEPSFLAGWARLVGVRTTRAEHTVSA